MLPAKGGQSQIRHATSTTRSSTPYEEYEVVAHMRPVSQQLCPRNTKKEIRNSAILRKERNSALIESLLTQRDEREFYLEHQITDEEDEADISVEFEYSEISPSIPIHIETL